MGNPKFHNCFSAAYMGLRVAVVVSVYGLDRMAIGTGLMSMTLGLANLITHPLSGIYIISFS